MQSVDFLVEGGQNFGNYFMQSLWSKKKQPLVKLYSVLQVQF